MSGNVMIAKDAMSASMAECYLHIGEHRYNFAQAIKIEAKFKKNKVKVPILGRTGKGNKAIDWEGTGSCTLHYNTSILRKVMLEFAKTGKDMYFDMQIINDDPNSAAGRQEIMLLDCNVDSGVIAKFDTSSGSYLDEDAEFTFESFSMPQEFLDLPGFLMS